MRAHPKGLLVRILVIDDDASVRSFCEVVLTNEGYEVLQAEDGPTGINLAREKGPHLIFLDWMMPGVDGVDTLRALKGNPRTRDIPVVMVTALDSIGQITLATQSGADGYVTKPFEVEDMLALARRFASSRIA